MKKILKICLAFILVLNVFILSGCWDSRELDKLFIVTGVAIDETTDDKIELSLQVGRTQPANTQKTSSTTTAVVLDTTDTNLLKAYLTLNENCSRGLLIEHNQVVLYGQAMAEKGIKQNIDLFIRVQEARIETPIVIVEGNAKEILNANLEQDSISAVFVAGVLQGLQQVSNLFEVRIIDFMKKLLGESKSAVIPLIKMVDKNGKTAIEYTGMAILKDGVMVGKLEKLESEGYVMAFDGVSSLLVTTETEEGSAGFKLKRTKSNLGIKIDDSNKLNVDIKITGAVELVELKGFSEYSNEDLIKVTQSACEQQMKTEILQSIAKSKSLNTDIFCIGQKIWQKNPKKWLEIKDNWDSIYQNADFNVEVEVELPVTGDTINSVEIENKLKEKKLSHGS